MLIQLGSVSPFPNNGSLNESILFQKTSTSLRSGNKSTDRVEEDAKCEVTNPSFTVEMEFDVVNEVALVEGLPE